MSILTVVRATIEIVVGTKVDAYTAGEISSTTGAPINYLSGRGLSQSIGLTEFTARGNQLPKELRALLGKEFTVRGGQYKMASGGTTKVSLWDTPSAATYYLYHAFQGNEQAKLITIALASTTLDIIINDRLNVDYKKGQAEQWTKARIDGKLIRRELTDTIADYIKRHPELSDNDKRWLFKNCTDKTNIVVLGKIAKKAAEELGCDRSQLRDFLETSKLVRLTSIEDLIVRLVDGQDVHPFEAVRQAAERLLIG